jgi:hypothetical protein
MLMTRNKRIEDLEERTNKLANLIIDIGPSYEKPISAIKNYAESCANELRFRQLETWLLEIKDRLEIYDKQEIDFNWLKSEPGLRVFLALGEGACDILKTEKIKLLANAQVTTMLINDADNNDKKWFARIVIDAELISLQIIYLMGLLFEAKLPQWKFEVEIKAIEIQKKFNELWGKSNEEINSHLILDALDDMHKYRLCSVHWTPVAGSKMSGSLIVEPRPKWKIFLKILHETMKSQK